MKSNQFNQEIRFLPIEIINNRVSIPKIYTKELEVFLKLNNIEHREDSANLNLQIDRDKLSNRLADKIINSVKNQRDRVLQREIKKNYL